MTRAPAQAGKPPPLMAFDGQWRDGSEVIGAGENVNQAG